jgi:FkbM family methyltransferase
MRINPRTGRDLYYGTRERPVQEALAERLKAGMVFYDLGANIGLFTLIGARCVGPHGRVFAFEPDPAVCVHLRENVTRNGFSNVDVVEAAVSSTTGLADFVRADPKVSPDLGFGRIDSGNAGPAAIRVRSIALKHFLQDAPAPNVIKCDVEGAETEIFREPEDVVNLQRPLIVCELHSQAAADRLRPLLSQLGYAVRDLDNNHILALP